MKKILTPQFFVVSLLILVATFSRLITNHFEWWNFTPIIAICLFSGAVFENKKLAFIIPMAVMIITDSIIGFYPGILVVYGSLLMVICIGFVLKNRIKVLPLFIGSLASSVVFYVVTNFALFYPTTLYPHTLGGIIDSYTQALPFFRTAIVGDLIFTTFLFGAYEIIKVQVPVLRKTA